MRGRQPEAGCRSSVIHPTTAARLRRPDRTSGRPSAGGSPSGGYSPLHCCPPPASRPHHRGCEPGGNEGLRGYGVLKPFEDAGTWRIRCVGRAVKACFQQPALPTQMSLVPLRPRPSGSAFQNAIPPQSARFPAGRSPVRPVTTFRAAPQPPGTSHTHLRDTPH